MIVFKTFLKILNKNKGIVILYTVILLLFGGFNMQTQEKSMNFVASKPDILIVNNDEKSIFVDNFIKYIDNNSNIIDIENNEDKINDALFYRDVNYVVYIPENFGKDFLSGLDPEIRIKSTGDYQASLSEMIVSRYLKVAKIYRQSIKDENELVSKINDTLSKKAEVNITTTINTTDLEKATFYFNFESYSLLACLIYVICLVLSTFNNESIRKRTIISSVDCKKNNRELLLSNCLYSLVVWLFYLVASFILIGDVLFSLHGVIYAINSLIFTLCATTIAFCLGNVVNNKNAINGIVNVIALGSSFLCGAFVPLRWLPSSVLTIAKFLPTYYYVKTNESLTSLEVFNFDNLIPLIINMGIVLLFSIVFVVLSNIISNKKRKIG